VISLNSEEAVAYINLGLLFHQIGQPENAALAYTEAMRVDPKIAIAYLNRGAAYNDMKQHEKAVEDINEAIRLNPKEALAFIPRLLPTSNWDNRTKLSRTTTKLSGWTRKVPRLTPDGAACTSGPASTKRPS